MATEPNLSTYSYKDTEEEETDTKIQEQVSEETDQQENVWGC